MSMREINVQEMLGLMDSFKGRQIEVDLHPIRSSNTYHWFNAELLRDTVIFSDMDNDHPQELRFYKDEITEIDYVEGENVFQSVFTVNMVDSTQIQLCVYELPVRCFKCQKILNLNPMENVWEINGTGGYGSHFDNERLNIKVCDDCLYEMIGDKVGELCE